MNNIIKDDNIRYVKKVYYCNYLNNNCNTYNKVWNAKIIKNNNSNRTSPKWVKWVHRSLSNNHCEECLKLDGCWFLKFNAPKHPHHPFCHCVLEDILYNDVLTKSSSNSAYSKFDPYLFNTEGKYPHNKEKLFESWGYTVEDSKWLQKEIEKQGLEKYVNGEYELGKLDYNGQRLSIRVEIPRKDQLSKVSFTTGWMLYPNGKIQLATPYGGK